MRPAIATHGARVQIRPWPRDPSTRLLSLLDIGMTPSVGDVDRWLEEVFDGTDPDVRRVRTGALFPAAARAFRERGFVEIDRLALLERHLNSAAARPSGGTRQPPQRSVALRRLRLRDFTVASEIDVTAFDSDWGNDADALHAIASATPHVRSRLAYGEPTRWGRAPECVVGFCITGRAGTTGYVQRLAVRDDARRKGVGQALVDDAMRWLTRRGATRALVNTGTSNTAALALYESSGFHRCADELVVLEHDALS